MRDMKAKLLNALAKQNPALAALVAAPELSDDAEKAALAEAYACAPWSREALGAIESLRPGTAKRYAAALASATGPAYEAIFDQLSREASQLAPF